MAENIKKGYVEGTFRRRRFLELESELKRWLKVLKDEYNPEKVIVFGSFATQKTKEWSDLDLIIIKHDDKSFLDRSKEVLLLLHPKVGVDILVYTPSEYQKLCEMNLFFKEEIMKKGVVIYER